MKHLGPFYDRTLTERPGWDVDALLRDFLRSEMPDPWPAPPTPTSHQKPVVKPFRPAPRWHHARRHLALAAALGLLLIGYLALAQVFPAALPGLLEQRPYEITVQPNGGIVDDSIDNLKIQDKSSRLAPNTFQTPDGNALITEHNQNGTFIIRVQALPGVNAKGK